MFTKATTITLSVFLIILVNTVSCGLTEGLTFKNVQFKVCSVFTCKINKTIKASNSLKDFIPEIRFDKLEFVNQAIPVLYKDAISDIDHLDELVMNSDGITEIQPGAIINVPRIRTMSFKMNELQKIKEGVFNDLPVYSIDLSFNKISEIEPMAFSNMPKLLLIRLSDNAIKKWNPEWFTNSPAIMGVSIQNNLIEELPKNAFKNFKGEREIGDEKMGKNLMFSHNKIKTIHKKIFDDLGTLNDLFLDYNQIETIDAFAGLKAKLLRLNGNQIKCIKKDDVTVFKNVEKIHLGFNPWDCDCLKELKTSSDASKFDLVDAESECIAQNIKKKMENLVLQLKDLSKKYDEINRTYNSSEILE